MKVISEHLDLESFFQKVKTARERALLLDYDGTLAPFRVERDAARPYPGVKEILEQLISRYDSRIVIISGRTIDDLIPLLDLENLPELWGSHGWERLLPDGSYRLDEFESSVLTGMAEAESWAEREGLWRYCEKKPSSIALHLRGLDPSGGEEIRNAALSGWETIAGSRGLEIHEFDGGVELSAPGRNKGDAVNMILEEMAEGTAAAYLGDDSTDEDAFRAITGRGLAVLVRDRYRETAAHLWIEPPGELIWFLEKWKELCPKQGRRALRDDSS
jgi:trehalose 6-phosphate phosphatase